MHAPAALVHRVSARGPSRTWLDQAIAAGAIVMVIASMAGEIATSPDSLGTPIAGSKSDAPPARPSEREGVSGKGPEIRVGAYGGIPYTHASDLRFVKPGATDLTVKDVGWDGRPFKTPIYYGLRVLAWSFTSPFGGMLDFTHSKAIARKDDVVRFSGKRDGKDDNGPARIGDRFRHLEFSHGHNMLTLNGLLRLASLSGVVVPYVGLGGGINLPHTEVQFLNEAQRTYMYQYAGLTGQAVAGVEVRLGRLALFLEYKLTVSPYSAPLYDRTTPSTWYGRGITDFLYQLERWWTGTPPEGGTLTTSLVSHQAIGGISVRVSAPSPVR
jgi:hypothetical protein